MKGEDERYLERRALQELECAQQASTVEAVKAHYTLLGHYLNRLYPETAAVGAKRMRNT